MTENTEDTATNTKSDTPAKSRGRRRRRPQAWTIDQFVVEPVEGKARFHDLDLPLSLMRGIADLGFEYCTPIQAESLPHALDGHDVVGKAQTGTGKTAAFLLNIITDLINHPIEGERFVGEARSMILAPTRELALQIAEDAVQLTRHTGLHVHALVGGMDYAKQLKHMETRHCDILVGTPGRLLDFANNRDVHLDQVEVLVIDEADRMLDMGFIPQVRRLVRLTPRNNERQTMLFSATFTPEVMRLSEQWTDSPVRIEIGAERVATDTVEQKIYITTSGEKFSLLNAILKGDNVQSVMVFANRRDICRRLHEKLGKKGFKVGLLSGDVPQTRRMKTLEAFKNGSVKVMVATDVAGRGIHVDGVSHVINYTLPEEPEDYVHRIGRTGRAGETGTSISFACEDDAVLLEPIEKLLGQKLPCTMPDEVFVKTPKAAKPDKEPSAALKEKEEPSAALKEKQEPSAAPKENKEPSAALKEKQEPSAALKENEEPSASVKENQEPSAALKENEEPSASVKEKQEPSAALKENKEPLAALKENQEPSAAPKENQEPSASPKEDKEPSASPKEDKEPSAALKENEEPSASLKEKQEPSASVKENQEPSAALKEKQEPLADEEPSAEDRQPPAQ